MRVCLCKDELAYPSTSRYILTMKKRKYENDFSKTPPGPTPSWASYPGCPGCPRRARRRMAPSYLGYAPFLIKDGPSYVGSVRHRVRRWLGWSLDLKYVHAIDQIKKTNIFCRHTCYYNSGVSYKSLIIATQHYPPSLKASRLHRQKDFAKLRGNISYIPDNREHELTLQGGLVQENQSLRAQRVTHLVRNTGSG